jgi:hypothetical protein
VTLRLIRLLRASTALPLALCAAGLAAQTPPSPAPADDAQAPKDPPLFSRMATQRMFDPVDGQLDIGDFLASARGFLPIPVIVTEPAVGYGGGLVGMFVRPRREAGDDGWSRPDLSAVGGFATENGTWGAMGFDARHWLDGRVKTLAAIATGQVNLDFHGLGTTRPTFDQAVRYTLDFTGTVLQANWKVAPQSPWAIGARYVYAQVEPKLRDEPAFPGLADRSRVKVSAPGAILEYDSRDNVFTPTRGVYAESFFMASRESLGASTDFERFQQVGIGWLSLRHDVVMALRGDYQWASDSTPFFLRPYVVLRGVPAVRYQGNQMGSFEVEGRRQFHGRWSAVAFGGAGTARTNNGDFSATQSVGAGGVGFRYELARQFGLHAGLDVARSRDTTAVYIVIGNAWFRP